MFKNVDMIIFFGCLVSTMFSKEKLKNGSLMTQKHSITFKRRAIDYSKKYKN